MPYASEASDTAALLVADLAANVVTHGRGSVGKAVVAELDLRP